MNAVTEPLARIQSELEAKISRVLTELDTLRRTTENNNNNDDENTRISTKLRKQQMELVDEFDEYSVKNVEVNIKKEENQARIRHLENVQEKQFDMMSQLISMIGKENTNANLTVSSGRESLNRIRKQFEEDELIQMQELKGIGFFDDKVPKCEKQKKIILFFRKIMLLCTYVYLLLIV